MPRGGAQLWLGWNLAAGSEYVGSWHTEEQRKSQTASAFVAAGIYGIFLAIAGGSWIRARYYS